MWTAPKTEDDNNTGVHSSKYFVPALIVIVADYKTEGAAECGRCSVITSNQLKLCPAYCIALSSFDDKYLKNVLSSRAQSF